MDIAVFCREGKLSRMKVTDFFEAILKLEAELSFLTCCSSVHWLFWLRDPCERRLAKTIESVWEIRTANVKIKKLSYSPPSPSPKRGSHLAYSVVGDGGEGDPLLNKQLSFPVSKIFHASSCFLWKHLASQEPLGDLRHERVVCPLWNTTCIQASARSN